MKAVGDEAVGVPFPGEVEGMLRGIIAEERALLEETAGGIILVTRVEQDYCHERRCIVDLHLHLHLFHVS